MTKEAYLSSLVPRMYKSEFDDKAAEILAEHCPEALEKPMPVPIEEITRDKLHLLIKEYHLDSVIKDEQMKQIRDLQDFVKNQPSTITEFDETLVSRLIAKITVFDDHFTVEFKSGITINIEA